MTFDRALRDKSFDFDQLLEELKEFGESFQQPSPGKVTKTGKLYRSASAPQPRRKPAAPARRARADRADSGSARSPEAGELLPEWLRHQLQRTLGVELGGVQIHRGPGSSQAAASLNAQAYTVGQDIYFASGRYDPSSAAGRHLIAHEVAHTVQQRGVSAWQPGLEVSQPGDRHEAEAERFADGFLLGGAAAVTPVSEGVVARALVQRQQGEGVSFLVQHIGGDRGRAEEALRRAAPADRASVEAAIRQSFDQEEAQSIIAAVPASGGEAPPADPAVEEAAGAEREGGAGGEGEADGEAGGEPAATGDEAGGAGPEPTGGDSVPGPDVGQPPVCEPGDLGVDELGSGDLALIHEELIEHQRWQGASGAVGEARSSERAAFIADQAGAGLIGGAASGAAMGFVMGFGGQMLAAYCPIPGVGPMIAGAVAGYALVTRDWGQTADTISSFGEGSSEYEVLANSIGAVSEIIDVACQVMNVIAGILGVIVAVMWIITIVTAGVASPLAATLTAIAAGIVTVTAILDAINNLLLQPLVLVFRALHTFQNQADPREVEAEGAAIQTSANKVGSALGGLAGGAAANRAAGAATTRIDRGIARRQTASGRGGPEAPTTRTGGPEAPTTRTGGPDAPAGRTDGPDAPRPRTDGPDAPARPDGPDGPARSDGPDGPARTDGPDGPARTEADAPTFRQWRARSRAAIRELRSQGQLWATGKARIREQFRAHTQERVNIHIQREREIRDAHDQATRSRSDEIEGQRSAEHERVDQRQPRDEADAQRAGDNRTERVRRDAEAEAGRERVSSGERRAAELEAVGETSSRLQDAERIRHEAAIEAIDRSYIDERLINNGAQRQIEDAGRLNPEFDYNTSRQVHDERIAALEADYNRRTQAETSHHVDRNAGITTEAARRAERAQSDHHQRAADIAARADGRVRDADSQTAADVARVRSEADRRRADADTRAQDAQPSVEGAGRRAAADATPGANQRAREGLEGWWGRPDVELQSEIDPGPSPTISVDFFGQEGPEQTPDEQQSAHDARFAEGSRPAGRPESASRGDVVPVQRLNPDYQDPPGTPEQIACILDNIEATLAARAERQGREEQMTAEEARSAAEGEQIDALGEQANVSIDNHQLHQQAVASRQQANQEQQQRQQNSEQLISGYPSRAAGVTVLTTALGAFAGFTHIMSVIPGSAGRAMARINRDSTELLRSLTGMDEAMEEQATTQPEVAAGLGEDNSRLETTASEAEGSGTELESARASAEELAGANAEQREAAAAARAEAAEEGAVLDGSAGEQRSQYQTLAAGLSTWASQHRAAREAAIATQREQAQGAAPSEAG